MNGRVTIFNWLKKRGKKVEKIRVRILKNVGEVYDPFTMEVINFRTGNVVEVSKEFGKRLIEDDYAEKV